MMTKLDWVAYHKRSLATKAPFKVVESMHGGRPVYRLLDRNGILNYTYVHKERAEARCEMLNTKAAEVILRE